MARLFKSHLQGDFGSDHKNFEAVVLEGRDIWHWWRDNSADMSKREGCNRRGGGKRSQ